MKEIFTIDERRLLQSQTQLDNNNKILFDDHPICSEHFQRSKFLHKIQPRRSF